ncbi:MAG: amidohydrolase family protein [Verrucomicrobiales bacterium]|nr:amidohydrolase family protein [Verrucomicrobiales bacterium]
MKPMIVDAHVHMVGNGSSGSGCRLRLSGAHRFLARFMLQHIGLSQDALAKDLDRIYVERLLGLIKESSIHRIVLLAHDEVYHADGRVMDGVGSLYVPNDHLLELTRQFPEFLPGVSIHPARADALAELERAIEGGAVLMKCLPNCHNIDCNDRRYTPFWERMAEADLPLLAHTGGEHTVPVVRAELADPRVLTLPLECGVKVIAAHCGTRSGLRDPDYFEHFREMTQRYPNLYGDTSAFNLPMRGLHIRKCLQSPLRERLVHGSDFPVPIQGLWAWMRGLLPWKEYRRCQRIPNVIERDVQLKRAMGFDAEHFSRIASLLR